MSIFFEIFDQNKGNTYICLNENILLTANRMFCCIMDYFQHCSRKHLLRLSGSKFILKIAYFFSHSSLKRSKFWITMKSKFSMVTHCRTLDNNKTFYPKLKNLIDDKVYIFFRNENVTLFCCLLHRLPILVRLWEKDRRGYHRPL